MAGGCAISRSLTWGELVNQGVADDMARGRLKDKKTRKKHRKNIKRMKALAKARRDQAHAAKSKRK